jgi:DNA-binding XRE family transcriptional regulator
MIEKLNLKDGSYYIGACRNTNVAKWYNGKFIFINLHFGEPYVETIDYYGDVKNQSIDGFIPIREIKIIVDDIIAEKNKQDYKNGARNIYKNLNINNLKHEIWKPIPEYEGLYYVSNLGRIKKHGYPDYDKIMRQNFIRDYLVVGLSLGKNKKTFRVHRLVAMAFKNSDNLNLIVNHINGIKTDNREDNLEWIERSENSRHTYTSGIYNKKLTPNMVLEIKKMLKEGIMQKEIANKFNVSRSAISEINTGKKWKNIKIMEHT